MVISRPRIAEAVRVEQVSDLVFRAWAKGGRPGRVFGGQLMAQALAAAGHTVGGDLHVHMIHAVFPRSGDPTLPLELTLDPIADRGSFARRRVVVNQGPARVLELIASFHRDEPGPEHQMVGAADVEPGAVPSPGALEGYLEGHDDRTRKWWSRLNGWSPLEIRAGVMPGRWRPADGGRAEPRQHVWFRAPGPLPDDRLLHSCAAVYGSDLFLLTAAMVRHGLRHDDEGVFAVTLDHTMWFHHPFRADDWWLYEQEGIWTGAGRALCRGQMFDRSGRLVATSMQEGLLRLRRPGARDAPSSDPSAGRPTVR